MKKEKMSQGEIATEISESVVNSTAVKIYFKDNTRYPLIGIFVDHKDAFDLETKGMYRFVTFGKIEKYENSNEIERENHTQIISINTLTQIRLV